MSGSSDGSIGVVLVLSAPEVVLAENKCLAAHLHHSCPSSTCRVLTNHANAQYIKQMFVCMLTSVEDTLL